MPGQSFQVLFDLISKRKDECGRIRVHDPGGGIERLECRFAYRCWRRLTQLRHDLCCRMLPSEIPE